MKRTLLAAMLLILAPLSGDAATVHTERNRDLFEPGSLIKTGRQVITAGDLDPSTAVCTGWISLNLFDDIVLDVDLTRVATTRVDAVCYQDYQKGGAVADAAVVPHYTYAGAGTFDGVQQVARWATTTNVRWTAVFTNISLPWVNCCFTGVAATTDTIDVNVLGVTP